MKALPLPRTETFARWRPIATWWALSRLVTVGAFAVTGALGPRGYLGPSFYRSPFDLLGAWDGVWYQRIAEHGYLLVPGRQSDPAFFPLFPILLRVLHWSFGLPVVAAGALVSNLSLLVAAVAFYEVGRRVVPDDVALRAAVFAMITPLAFVYSMVYPEGLLFALATLALLAALDGRWLAAAGLAAAAALARPEALTLALPLAAIASSRSQRLDPAARGRALAAVVAAPAALSTYPLYLRWSLGDAHAWGRAQKLWGRAFNLTGPLRAATRLPAALHAHPGIARDVILLAVYAVLLVVAARQGVGRSWIAAGGAIILLPLFSGSFESEGRFGLLALPAYWGLAAVVRSRLAELVSLGFLVAGVLTLPYVWP